ncbi:MAG: alpha/beta fold hydrolase [Anaeromyxobacter sp.]
MFHVTSNADAPAEQSHHLPCDLPWGKRSRAHWALQGDGSVILFVHGFGGASETTWHAFPAMLPREPKCRSTDVVFYGYDSLRSGVIALATRFREFLQVVLESPSDAINPTIDFGRRPKGFQYKKVIVVAHSLGAVVARRALLDLAQLDTPGLDRVRLVLFAPAHLGADILPLAREALGVIRLVPIAALASWSYRALRDLDPRPSPVLQQLMAETQKLTATPPSPHIARVVVHGYKDRIVAQQQFCADPLAKFEPKNHVALCKPDAHYTNPIDYVMGAL